MFGSLRRFLPPEGKEGRVSVDVPPGGRVRDALRAAGAPDAEAAVILVNGEHVEAEAELREGDVVSLFPPI